MNINNSVLFNSVIKDKILTLRNTQVMLNKDLSSLYGVKPIRLREQVRRNSEKFPLYFMVLQNAIPSKKQLGGSTPHLFAKPSILLSSIPKSDIMIKMDQVYINA